MIEAITSILDGDAMVARDRLRSETTLNPRAQECIGRIEKAGPIMVIDPEEAIADLDNTLARVRIACEMGMSAIELGGSTDMNNAAEIVIPRIRQAVDKVGSDTLLISFPGTASQVVEGIDIVFSLHLPQMNLVQYTPEIAEFFRSNYFEIIDRGEQLGVPVISVPYILFSAGNKKTTVEQVTGVDAIDVSNGVNVDETMTNISPWIKKGDLVMLEAGSGPEKFVNLGSVAVEVVKITEVSPIVTGGISSPECMQQVTRYINTPVVFGSVAESTLPNQFGKLYQGFRASHPSCW